MRAVGVFLALVGGAALAAPAVGDKAVATAPPPSESRIDWTEARQHWSFRAPQARPRPAVKRKDWPRQPLDWFVLSRLEQKGFAPAPEADRRTLVRRLTYDLTGLPPTPEEVGAFLADARDGAYERLVDRLLASPRFGERLASMWLPLARYAEDQAHQVGNDTKFFYPNAHLYRQWVVDAFNRDLPYDRFVRLQLAADSLRDEKGSSSSELAALGFLGLGPKYYNRNRLDVMADEWQDRVDTVTRTFLGLTVACARCHDHKYDPVTMHDYYALAGVFASTKMVNKAPSGVVAANTEAAKFPKDALHIVEDDKPQDLNIFLRGNVENKGPVAPRRFLRVLSDADPEPFRQGSGRSELAEAIVAPGNPLTARVMVNRLWGQVFGNPLVGTPSNFGLLGDQPTHPELLDDLAIRFVKNGWSVKSAVREMVLSATYRQSSVVAAAPQPVAKGKKPVDPMTADPANALLWRMNRRRLSVEQWRDSVLFTSGQLDLTGGPSLELTDPANRKRTLYARISRLKLDDFLTQFDYPDANVHAEKRAVTTTPMQKLFVLNSPFAQEQAKALAARLTADAGESDPSRVTRAYQLLYAREPTAAELDLALAYLSGPAEGMPRWERYAQVLLAANEMMYLD